MQEKYQDVMNIRRIWKLLLMLALLLALAPQARAASARAGAVTTGTGSLNVRTQPSSGSPVAATLKKGSYVTLHSRSGQWWQVEYDKGKFGYCHSRYLTVVEGTPVSVRVSSGSLNVRTGPGTGYARAASLYSGETVLLLTTGGEWSRVLYHGTRTGWVSSPYLSGYFPAVSVTIPSFKQTDPRWAEKTVGTSGKPFSQIGCATTAVAMLESARQSRTIYPDEMSRQLQYTPSGDLYWPSHYTPSTDPSGYLARIYQLLAKGKPILLGMKNANGSQHWVVVTGFQGGTALIPSAFTIHDPGTYSRTTLSQLQTVYPTFYKYFTY